MVVLVIAIFCISLDYRYKSFVVFKKLFVAPRTCMLQAVNFPFEVFRNVAKNFIAHNNLLQENIYLRQLNKFQSANLQVLRTLELENIRLKNLLQFSEQQKQVLSLASVIDVSTDPFKHQIVLNKGLKHGVYVGQPIINANGVLGSIVSVEKTTSIAMLITDINYGVPVLNIRNGFRAIALGTGNPTELILQHVPHTADIQEDDVFVTSGIGGKYPPGYKVGIVKKVQHEINFPFAEILLRLETQVDSSQEVLLVYGNVK
jgi:rod shape-determining protein MreC